MRVRIKVCGVTRREDALAAAEAGVDAVGLNFIAGGPRALTPESAAIVAAHLPPFVLRIGVFADPDADSVRRAAQAAGLDLAQLHGDESPAACAGVPLRWFKAHRVDARFRPDDVAAYGGGLFLLDGAAPGLLGGGGRTFDWQVARAAAAHGRVVLAGGLDPDNVGEAIRVARPFAVDVNSGIESAPGRKDRARLRLFCRRVAEAGLRLEDDLARETER